MSTPALLKSLTESWMNRYGRSSRQARRGQSSIMMMKSERVLAAQQLKKMGRLGQSLVSMAGSR